MKYLRGSWKLSTPYTERQMTDRQTDDSIMTIANAYINTIG